MIVWVKYIPIQQRLWVQTVQQGNVLTSWILLIVYSIHVNINDDKVEKLTFVYAFLCSK